CPAAIWNTIGTSQWPSVGRAAAPPWALRGPSRHGHSTSQLQFSRYSPSMRQESAMVATSGGAVALVGPPPGQYKGRDRTIHEETTMPAPAVDRISYDELIQEQRIHASLYTDPRLFADEMEQIVYQGWVFVGHDSEIPRPGDFVTRAVGTQPVIMVRGTDGAVAVLSNRCSHRGTMVCPAAHGNTRAFSCPYHGWTYDLGGELLGVSYPGGYDGGFDKAAHGLPRPPRMASYRGFVFASFAADGPSLDEHLGPATQLIDRACELSPEGEVELSAGWVKHRCPANWKILPENDIDGYHLGFVHLALWKTVRTQYQRVIGEERSIKAVVRDWGNGHIEIDWAPGYQDPFEWFGGVSQGAGDRYLREVVTRYCDAQGRRGALPWR